MCKFPYMKLYPADLIADTEELSAAQFGSYVRILAAMWRKGGSFPLHHSGLARIAGVDVGNWKRHIWPAIKGYFKVVVEKVADEMREVLTQKRLSAELQKATAKREARLARQERGDHSPGRGVPLGVNPLESHDADSQSPESTTREETPYSVSSPWDARARGRPERGRRAPRRNPQPGEVIFPVRDAADVLAEIRAERAAQNGRFNS